MGAVVAGAIFGAGAAGTLAYAATAFLVNLGISLVLGRLLAPDAPSLSAESRELKRTIRAPASPRRVIYGETLCGGNLVFTESTGSTNQYLHMVIAYAGHQVNHIGDIYINDTLSTDSRFGSQNATVILIGFLFARFINCDTPTNVTYHIEVDGVEYSNASLSTLASSLPTSQYTASSGVGTLTLTGNTPGSAFTVNRAWREADCNNDGVFVQSTLAYTKETQSNALLFINKHNGAPDQDADSDLVSNVTQWTDAHQLQGIAYLYIRLKYDDSVWLTGIPQVRAVIRGKEIYNPVTSEWAWTDNWALCVRDYLTSEYGLECDSTEIESTLMAAAISTSDEEVEHPGPGRYKYEWGWDAITDLHGWTAINCSLTTDTTDPDHDNELITPSTTNPYIYKGSLSVDGYVYYKVRALVKRVTGSGWEGNCYYSTSGHSYSGSYYKNVTEPSGIDSDWTLVEWDMSSLTVGGTDWTDNTITGIRLDLASDATTEFRVAFVSVSKPYKRYTCNGAFALDQKPADIMDKILSAGAGSLVFSQGQYRLYAGEYHTPTVTLDESDLRGPIKVRPRQSRKDLFNEVKGLYIEPNQFWEAVEFPIVQNSTYVTQDNSETITREIELPFTQDPYTAQRIAKIHLEKSRQGITIEYPCKLTALQLSAMDTVLVNNTDFGWSSKVFRILSWALSSDGGIDLVMQEEASATYDWNNGNATFVDPAPDTNLPSPWTLTAPDTLTLNSTATHHISNADGSTSVRIYVTWSKTDDRQKGFDVEYKISSQSNWTRNSTNIPDVYDYIVVPIDGTNYDVRVRGVSSIGVYSDWVTESNHTVPTGNVATSIVNQGDLAILDQADWDTQVVGAGKPDDNATVGAIWDSNISGQPTDAELLNNQQLWDDIQQNPLTLVSEYFDGPTPTDSNWRWVNQAGFGELSISTDAYSGNTALQVGNNSGNDRYSGLYHAYIPYNSAKMYRVTAIAKMTAGSGKAYFSVREYNSTPAYIGVVYVAADGVTLTSSYSIFRGYFTGTGTHVNGTNTNTIDSPSPLTTGTAFFKPYFIVNYNGVPGITLIDSFVVEEVEDGSAWDSVAGSGKPSDNADVTQSAIETGITITAGYLTGGTDTILLDYANRRFTGGDETWEGVGWQFEYNLGSPRAYIGNGDTKYIEFDGTDLILGEDTRLKGAPNVSDDGTIFIDSFIESLDGYEVIGDVLMSSPNQGVYIETASVTSGDASSISARRLDVGGVWSKKKRATFVVYHDVGIDNKYVWLGIGSFYNGATTTNFVGFQLDYSRSSTWIRGLVHPTGGSTVYQGSWYSDHAADENTAMIFTVHYDPDNTQAEFFIDGASIGTLSTTTMNTASTVASDYFMYVMMENSTTASGAGGETITLKRYKFWQEG